MFCIYSIFLTNVIIQMKNKTNVIIPLSKKQMSLFLRGFYSTFQLILLKYLFLVIICRSVDNLQPIFINFFKTYLYEYTPGNVGYFA